MFQERCHKYDQPDHTESKSNGDSNAQYVPTEDEAIQNALAESALAVACATATGMHKLEQETPLTYKQVLLSKRRAE